MNNQELEIGENFVYEIEIKDGKISTRPWEPTINELYHSLDDDLILQLEFQRYYIWVDNKSSRLIYRYCNRARRDENAQTGVLCSSSFRGYARR